MEPRQAKRLTQLFGPHLRAKRVVTLRIPDIYAYNDPALIALLEPKLRSALRP